MKYILYITFLMCLFSCDSKDTQYTCTYLGILDNYPKGVKEMKFESRELACILNFRNGYRDTVFFPFGGIVGNSQYKSSFYVKHKNLILECPATFWGDRSKNNVVAPGESIRISVYIDTNSLPKLHIKEDIDIKDLDKKISIYYKFEPQDTVHSHLTTPRTVQIIRRKDAGFIYGANLFDIWKI